jgi:hypothetical protein
MNCDVCGKEYEMHLGDYATNSDEIKILCERHRTLEESRKHPGVLWEYCDDFSTGRRGRKPKWCKIWVIPLTDNAIDHRDMNCPNTDGTMLIDEFSDKHKAGSIK